VNKKATELGGFGVGLPLSRLYANYLGGSINVVSLPNYGTHTYVFLPRLPEQLIEIVPERAALNEAWGKVTRSNGEFIL
jgi:triacylglycerol esterase/lipase EstA (alpha/beta hydrolase family)